MKGSTPGGPCIIMQVAILIACCGMMAFVAHQMYKANEEHQEIIRASLREAGRGSRTGTLSPPPAGETNDASEQSLSDEEGSGSDSSSSDGTYSSAEEAGLDEDDYGARTRFSSRTSRGSGSTYNYRRRASGSSSIGKKRLSRAAHKFNVNRSKNKVVNNYYTIQHMGDEAGLHFFGAGFASRPPQQGAAGPAATPGPTVEEEVEEQYGESESGVGGAGKTKSGGVPNAGEGSAGRSSVGRGTTGSTAAGGEQPLASEIEHLRKEIPVMLASLKTYARLVVRLQNSANKKRKKHSGYPARLARKALAAFERRRNGELPTPEREKRRQHESALADEIKREVSTGHVAGPFQLQEQNPTEYAAENDNGAAFTEEIESRSPADLLNYLRSSKTAVQFAMQKLWLFVSARIGHFKIDLRADYELQKVQPGAPQPASGAASGSSRGGARGVITRSTSGSGNNPLSPLANFFQNSFAPTSGASASGAAAPDRFGVHMGSDAAGSEVNAGPSTIYQHAVKYECDFLGVKPHVIGTREEVPLIDVHAMDALDSSSDMPGPNGRVGGAKAPGLADDLVAQWRPMLDEFSSMSGRNGGRSTGSVMPAFASSSGASHNDETSIFGSMGGMLGDDADSPENSM
eukprot:g7111.t1